MYIHNSCLRYIIALSFFFSLHSFTVCGQTTAGDQLQSSINAINNVREQFPVEKLYLQTDKPNYLQNDTLWFKAYLLNADFLTAATRSGLLYIELDDDNNRCVKRMMVPVVDGLSWGYMALDGGEINEGSYTLRAYTNWMRNFGEDRIFEKGIYIASVGERSHLVTTDFKEARQGDKENIRARLLFVNLNKQPVRLQDMQIRVMDGKHTLLKNKATTGLDGDLDINFNIPGNTSSQKLSIVTHDINKNYSDTINYTIPVVINNPENIDLQFMPEGGTFLAGIPAKIGFKAINEDGRGIEVSGKIYDSKQQQVATFQSLHKGMGSFSFIPQAGETYIAKLTLPDSGTKSYPLPLVNKSGISLAVNNNIAGDSLQVNVSATPDLLNAAAAELYLMGQSRGVVCYAAHLTLKYATLINQVPKSAFPTGITRFTLLNSANLPLAERLVYINHNDNLQISVATNQKIYAPHDSIALNIRVSDKAGKPVRGSFSVAVTDDSQVKTDSIGINILNDMLLTADLKGTVEEPAYYFEGNTPQRAIALDNLLLTQGWVGYDWKQVFGPPMQVQYKPEPQFAIRGTVTNVFNKPVAGTEVTVLSKKPLFVADTVTDTQGRFMFSGFLPVDTASFLIDAKNKHGKNFNVGINIDEFKPPVFTLLTQQETPWYVNSDMALFSGLNNQVIKQQQEAQLQGPGHILKTVIIKDKKVIKGSKNLNGPGEADQVLDEQDMLKAGKTTLGDMLAQKIKGFGEGFSGRLLNYHIYDEPVKFVIDGMFLDRFYSPTGEVNSYYQYIKQYLNYFTAEDITGIEVMYNLRYNAQYVTDYISARNVGDPIAFIEITTRSGKGPFMLTTAGTYLYKPLPATLPKQFYRPRYALKQAPNGTDLRSTIHWEPNMVTDAAGRATVSFYSADKPTGYTIIIEGTDLNGSIGFVRSKINIR